MKKPLILSAVFLLCVLCFALSDETVDRTGEEQRIKTVGIKYFGIDPSLSLNELKELFYVRKIQYHEIEKGLLLTRNLGAYRKSRYIQFTVKDNILTGMSVYYPAKKVSVEDLAREISRHISLHPDAEKTYYNYNGTDWIVEVKKGIVKDPVSRKITMLTLINRSAHQESQTPKIRSIDLSIGGGLQLNASIADINFSLLYYRHLPDLFFNTELVVPFSFSWNPNLHFGIGLTEKIGLRIETAPQYLPAPAVLHFTNEDNLLIKAGQFNSVWFFSETGMRIQILLHSHFNQVIIQNGPVVLLGFETLINKRFLFSAAGTFSYTTPIFYEPRYLFSLHSLNTFTWGFEFRWRFHQRWYY